MAEAVNNTDSGDCAAYDCQNADGQVVKRGVLLFVDDVDGLDFGVEVYFLEGLVALGLSSSQGVPVLFPSLNEAAVFVEHNRNDFEVVVEVDFLVFLAEILHEFPSGQVAFQIFDVVLDDF